MSEEWITTTEAVEISSYHAEHIRRLIRQGRVAGKKFGNTWQVHKASLELYMDMMKEKGERRGPKV
jgi:excisionase family DNA binding protein